MSDSTALTGTGAATTDGLLKPLGDVAHKAGAAVGAERPLVNCPIPRPFLEHINGSQDVKRIPSEYLPELAAEIRAKINATVQVTGGHLSSNLGVTELTIALHRVFDFATDRLADGTSATRSIRTSF